MRNIFPITFMALASLMFCKSALADQAKDLEAGMKASAICTPLKFDVKDIAKLLGLDIPDIPIDTNIGWDKNFHTVKTLVVAADKKLSSDIELGCQPSDEGAVFKIPGVPSPDKFRLKDNVSCTGTVSPDGSVPDLSCKNSGEIGKLLGAITDLNGQMKPLFQAVLAPR